MYNELVKKAKELNKENILTELVKKCSDYISVIAKDNISRILMDINPKKHELEIEQLQIAIKNVNTEINEVLNIDDFENIAETITFEIFNNRN